MGYELAAFAEYDDIAGMYPLLPQGQYGQDIAGKEHVGHATGQHRKKYFALVPAAVKIQPLVSFRAPQAFIALHIRGSI